MIRDNLDTDTDILNTRYRAGRGQSTLNIELGLVTDDSGMASGVQTGGGGGSVGGAGEVTNLTGGTSTGGASCPEINQYVLVRSDINTPIPTPVWGVQQGMYLWNPVAQTFEKVIVAQVVNVDEWWHITDGRIFASGSSSHPLIHTAEDNVGTPISKCEAGMEALTSNGLPTHITRVWKHGGGQVKHLETAGPGHIYCAGTTPNSMFVFHNLKPAPDES